MKQIKAVLQEELNTSVSMLQKFEMQLNQLPKGSIVEKEIGNQKYHYRAYRDKDKVKFDYLGRLSPKKLAQAKTEHRNRKRLAKSIRDLKKQIRYLKKVINAK